MRNNRNRNFASRSNKRAVAKEQTEHLEPLSCAPWEGNVNRFKTPHYRHPDLGLTNPASVPVKQPPQQQIVPPQYRVSKQPAGLGLNTGDRIQVWTDPKTGRLSVVNTRPDHFVKQEVVVVASFYEYQTNNGDDQWTGGDWYPVVWIPFPSEGAARLSITSFNGSLGVAGKPISGSLEHIDTELLEALKAKETDTRFRIIWNKAAFTFVAATKPPIFKSQSQHLRLADASATTFVEAPGRFPIGLPMIVNEDGPSLSRQNDSEDISEVYQLDKETCEWVPITSSKQNKKKQGLQDTYKVSKVKPKPLKLNPRTLVYHIFSMLGRYNRPLHISEMIKKLEKKNLLQNYGLHKYSSVYSVISKHYELFDKSGKATFSIRQAFKNKVISTSIATQPKKQPQVKTLHRTVKSLIEIVVGAAKEVSNPVGTYPGIVQQFLSKMGYEISYSSVYRIMQDRKLFSRQGFWYQLV